MAEEQLTENEQIGIFPHSFVEDNWNRIESLLDRTQPYANGEYNLSDVYHGLAEGEYLMWGHVKGDDIVSILVMNVLTFPRKLVMNIMLAAGSEMEKSESFYLNQIESFAKENDCDAIRLGGRKGWKRELKKFGYTEQYYILEKQLNGPG